MPITPREAEVLAWLDTQYQPMVDAARRAGRYQFRLARQGGRRSCRQDPPGASRGARRRLRGDRPPHGRLLPEGDRAACGRDRNDHVLLLGHRDTVFPKGTAKERPFRIEGRLGFGPGVSDMKAGLVMNAFVLEAFARVGGGPLPLVGLFTSDEEIASPASRPVIEAAARGARAVFNAEPGRAAGPGGNVVSGRKGAMFLTVEVTGMPAHSGGAHDKGVSAIEELCRKVTAAACADRLRERHHGQCRADRGRRLDQHRRAFGQGAGGRALQDAGGHGRGRGGGPKDPRDRASCRARRRALPRAPRSCRSSRRPPTSRCSSTTSPAPPSSASRSAASTPAARPNSGYTSAIGAPTLCGTGPIGARAHTPDEVCELDSMPVRAKALALAIMRLESGN